MIIHTFSFTSSILCPPICPCPACHRSDFGHQASSYVLFSFLRTVVCLLRYRLSLYTLPSLSLKLLLLVTSLIPFSIRFHHIHQFTSSFIADRDFVENSVSRLCFPGPPKSPGHCAPIPSTARPILRQSREPNTPHCCLSGSLQQVIWSLSQSNVTEFSKLQTSKGSTCPASEQAAPGVTNCCSPTLRNRGRYFLEGSYKSARLLLATSDFSVEHALDRFPKCERLDIWCRHCWLWWDWPVLRTSALCRAVR